LIAGLHSFAAGLLDSTHSDHFYTSTLHESENQQAQAAGKRQ
jgi:hypothetical protein